jgi:RHS repeat-associated protein
MRPNSSTTALYVLHPYTFDASRSTGKERDTESGLDYFGARYYASTMGRWMSPDWADKPEAVLYSKLDNPIGPGKRISCQLFPIGRQLGSYGSPSRWNAHRKGTHRGTNIMWVHA